MLDGLKDQTNAGERAVELLLKRVTNITDEQFENIDYTKPMPPLDLGTSHLYTKRENVVIPKDQEAVPYSTVAKNMIPTGSDVLDGLDDALLGGLGGMVSGGVAGNIAAKKIPGVAAKVSKALGGYSARSGVRLATTYLGGWVGGAVAAVSFADSVVGNRRTNLKETSEDRMNAYKFLYGYRDGDRIIPGAFSGIKSWEELKKDPKAAEEALNTLKDLVQNDKESEGSKWRGASLIYASYMELPGMSLEKFFERKDDGKHNGIKTSKAEFAIFNPENLTVDDRKAVINSLEKAQKELAEIKAKGLSQKLSDHSDNEAHNEAETQNATLSQNAQQVNEQKTQSTVSRSQAENA